MGLMEPEELSCNGVKTDKGSSINSVGCPERSKNEISRDGHLTETSCGRDNTGTLALTIVSDILDESIEIFNRVDEVNHRNNNCSAVGNDPSTAAQKLSNPDIKTDLVVANSLNIESSSELGSFDSDTISVSSLDHGSKKTDGMLSNSIGFNETVQRVSSSSEEDTESPLVSDSESSQSQSNENIPSHFSNIYIDKGNKPCNNLLNLEQDESNYCEVSLDGKMVDVSSRVKEDTIVETETDLHALSHEFDQPFESFSATNGFQSDVKTCVLESQPSDSNFEPADQLGRTQLATSHVSNSTDRHDCLNHPHVLAILLEHKDLNNMLREYKGKAQRLDDCLMDLEKVFDKVGLLEKKICQLEMELEICKQGKEMETKAHATLRQDSCLRIDSLKKQYDQANKEKESMVMRYAKSEKELLDMKKEKTTLMKQIKDQQKENENVLSKLRLISDDKSRLAVALDNKNMELSTTHKEIDKLKEDINSRDIKIKWIQNKLLGEMDLHKECPDKIEKLNFQILDLEKRLERNKEDIDQYKKTIQELEAIKVLEGQVREEQAKLILERHDQSERVIKMKALQLKTDALIEENNNLSFQVQNLEVERLDLEKRLSASRQESQELSNNLADLRSKLVEFDSISNQLTQERERLEKTNEEVERLRKANEELMQDMSTCRSREAEMLSFTQKLTTKNVQLQSEFSNIESRAGELMLEAEKAESTSDTLRRELKVVKEELEMERCKREEERNLLAREVAEGRSKSTQLESQLNEIKSNLHSSTNKHQAIIKELQRELQGCHRRLEQEGKSLQYNSVHQSEGRLAGSSPNQGSTGRSSPGTSSSLTCSLNSIPDATIVQPSHHQLELSPSILVERILKLQTDAKNYQDKIEFLEDHNVTLVEELKKKGRLLHSYILREQAGALSSQASDNHKLELSKHGGIMASVYGSRATDEGMTLELSLQINHKLQAILEDTLLKNITLKENIDTLGDEIQRLKRFDPS